MKKEKTGILLIASYFFLIFSLNLLSCNISADKSHNSTGTKSKSFAGYNFTDSDETIILPAILHEISGITIIDSSTIACVQDENGIVFIYDILRKEIMRQISFHGNGDYEGITRVNDTIYVLRSDGVLYEITNLKSSGIAREILLKKISDNDNEGLCYDQKNKRLLIAPKDKLRIDSEDKDIREIYGFDLKTGDLIKKPVINIDLSGIKKFASENMVFSQGKSKKENPEDKPDIKFRPSAIGIHPLTEKLFVLSATEKILYIFNLNGTIKDMIKLNPDIFNMPEGIAFFKNGDMLVSNEGQNKMPTLLRFNFKSN